MTEGSHSVAPVVVGRFQDRLPALDAGSVDLFLTDPPYNMGFDYGEVSDLMEGDAYAGMLETLATLTFEKARTGASFFVIHYPDAIARHWHELVVRPGWQFHQWLTWAYDGHTANPNTSKLRRQHRAILWLSKGEPKVYRERVRRPYRNPTDNRIRQRIKAGINGSMPGDVFYHQQVKMGSAEHLGYSNQIPQALLRELVLLTTDPGDLVVDPFSGTGSTVRAALSLGRRAWGCDANPQAARFWGDLGPIQRVLA